MKCYVPQCNSKYRRGLTAGEMHLKISFHPIPNDNKTTVRIDTGLGITQKVGRRDAWLFKTQIRPPLFNSTKVCSLHFKQDDYFKNPQRAVLKRNVVPSLNLPSIINPAGQFIDKINNYKTEMKVAEGIQFCSCVGDSCAKAAYPTKCFGINNSDDPLNIDDVIVKKEIPDLVDCKDPLLDPLFIPTDVVVKTEPHKDSHEASILWQEIKNQELDEWTMRHDYIHVKSEENSQVENS